MQVPEREPRVRDKYVGRLVFLPFDGGRQKDGLVEGKAQGHGSKEAHLHFIIGYSITSVARYSAAPWLFGNKRKWAGI